MFSNSLNDAHSQLERAILQQLQAERIDEKVIEMVQDAFSRALKGKKIVVGELVKWCRPFRGGNFRPRPGVARIV
jgi:hypothetical protein